MSITYVGERPNPLIRAGTGPGVIYNRDPVRPLYIGSDSSIVEGNFNSASVLDPMSSLYVGGDEDIWVAAPVGTDPNNPMPVDYIHSGRSQHYTTPAILKDPLDNISVSVGGLSDALALIDQSILATNAMLGTMNTTLIAINNKLAEPGAWQPPIVLARVGNNQNTNLTDPLVLTSQFPVPAGQRLLVILGYMTETAPVSFAAITDSAGNTYQPSVNAGSTNGTGYARMWECLTTNAITTTTTLSIPTVSAGFSGVNGYAAIVWVRAATVSGITGSLSNASVNVTATASLPSPVGGPGLLVISYLRKGGSTMPMWRPDSNTSMLDNSSGSGFGVPSLLGVNFPAVAPVNPAAQWTSSAHYMLLSVEMQASL